MTEAIRLQKVIMDVKALSRRDAEELIREGLITVNGRVAKLGDKAIPGKDHVKISGKLVQWSTKTPCVVAFFKPREMLSEPAREEAVGRALILPSVQDALGKFKERMIPVGRLDTDSEGILLLTNDGVLAQRLLQTRYEIIKTYSVKIDGTLDEKRLKRLEYGIKVEDKKIKPLSVSIQRNSEGKTWVKIALSLPQNRVVRKIFEAVGRPVDKVRRDSFAGISLRGLERGRFRILNKDEVKKLYSLVGL